MPDVVIHVDDLALFGAASHDHSPLHVDPDHARRTPFGRPVVYGVLGLLAALAHLAPRGDVLVRITVEFTGPLHEGIPYALEIEEGDAKARLTLREGARTSMRATCRFEARATPPADRGATAAPRRVAASTPNLEEGASIELGFRPDPAALAALMARYDLARRGVGEAWTAALLSSSYLVGMENPGERALFSRLSLELGPARTGRGDRAEVVSFDERFAMLTQRVELGPVVGEIRAIVRPPPVEVDAAEVARWTPPGEPLAGRIALIVGGARGLGAAAALALAGAGADVVATYSASSEAAARLAARAPRLTMVRAQAETVAGAEAAAAALDGRAIDLLLLSASPAVTALSMGPSTMARGLAFASRSLELAAVPLVTLTPRLAPGARVVVVSSTYVDACPPDFAHYAAAKGAIEAFVRAHAASTGLASTILRLPRLRTDMTNTAFGADDALAVERVAGTMVRHVASTLGGSAPASELLRWPDLEGSAADG